MIVRAGDLTPQGLQLDLRPSLGTLSYEEDLRIDVAAAVLQARVVPWRGGLRCTGRLEATTFVPCARCLEPFALGVDRRFDLTYLPPPAVGGPGGFEHQIGREDLDVAYLDEGRTLDLDTLAVEQIYLDLPMKPLCDAGCRGLCQRCGGSLNRSGCRCADV